MKKILFITSVVAVSAANIPPSSALNANLSLNPSDTPIEIFINAISNKYLNEEYQPFDTTENVEVETMENKMQLAQLNLQPANTEKESQSNLPKLSLDKLEFQILFHTGVDTLSERGKNKVLTIASFLQEHPDLSIRLTGHADPRGTDEYNNVLSEHRAISVQAFLETNGVTTSRIERRAFGALQSSSENGNFESYAKDRRVDIEILLTEDTNSIVQAH